MRSKTFKLDSARAHALKIISGIIMGIGMIPVLFIGLDRIKDGHLSDGWATATWPIGAVLFAGGMVWAIYLSYGYQSELTLTHQPDIGLQLFIRDPNGDETRAQGTWKWYAYFTKEYARYGMYRKHKHLVLFNKDRAYIAFASNGNVFDDPQPPFELMPGELRLNVHTYRTKEVDQILHEFAGSFGAEQIMPDIKSSGGNPGITVATNASRTAAPVKKEGAPEYGDPRHDL
jgi:hypothetical protein